MEVLKFQTRHFGDRLPRSDRLTEVDENARNFAQDPRRCKCLAVRRDLHPERALTWMRYGDGSPAVLWGTHNHDILEAAAPQPSEPAIDKNTSGAVNSTVLSNYLLALEVQNLVICGSATHHCVDNTARGAADRGYNVMLVEDACIDPDPKNHATTMRTFGRAFGAVKSTSQVIKELETLLARELEPSPVRA